MAMKASHVARMREFAARAGHTLDASGNGGSFGRALPVHGARLLAYGFPCIIASCFLPSPTLWRASCVHCTSVTSPPHACMPAYR